MNVLTIDLEEWYHLLEFEYEKYTSVKRLEENTFRLLSLLEDCKTRATFFVLGSIVETNSELIKTIASKHDVGIHGYEHRLLSSMSSEEIFNDIVKAKDCLEQLLGRKVDKYRAPGFSLPGEEVFSVLARCGIKTDCSASWIDHPYGKKIAKDNKPYTIRTPYGEIDEYPPSCFGLGPLKGFMGGGYFRILPYGYIRKYVKNHQDYSLFYIHPRDLDVNQPRIKELSPMKKFKAYVGTNSSEAKLRKLLTDFKFVSVQDAICLH